MNGQSTSTADPRLSESRSPELGYGRTRSTRRLPLAILIAGSLVAATVWRSVVVDRYQPVNDTFSRAGGASVKQFNSYTLGLLLGGLRGPLVMTLWSSSESQKGERNLEDINTKIELIRLLQPEFDAVHLFQIWNKAYNLSVQMSNLASKYATILDALEYADSARAGTANINLESAVASVYFDKLGNSAEKAYYRQRVREETQVPTGQTKIIFPASRRDEFIRAALAAGADSRRYTLRPESGAEGRLSVRLRDEFAKPILQQFTGADVDKESFPARSSTGVSGSLSTSHDTVLDAQGKLLPALVNRSRPADANDLDWRPEDGELAYLARFESYPTGVTPFAFAYNYYKRAVALQETKKQTHAQLSDRVISSRPALSLKAWAEEEIELGRQAEMAQLGVVPMSEEESPLPMELPAANLPIDAQPLTPLFREAIYNYDRAADIGERSVSEFTAHTGRYKDDVIAYTNQLADVAGRGELARGDSLYLQTITATNDADRRALAARAAQHYAKSIEYMNRNVLAFYTPDAIIAGVFPSGYGKVDVINSFENPAAFPAELVAPTMQRALEAMMRSQEPPGSEVAEYQTYVARAQQRLDRLAPLLAKG